MILVSFDMYGVNGELVQFTFFLSFLCLRVILGR